MSEDSNNARIMQFRKGSGATESSCTLSVFEDGSAHILGESLEFVFEGDPDAWLEAIAHLQSMGYQQVEIDPSTGLARGPKPDGEREGNTNGTLMEH